ncbi:hypothetical protein VIGAN_01502500 [Vigna angularis var. angularis]|uniref:Uncharacterized protein n=1 Tax=Vigna angularis var. angularis TaxID=157739 RepID=A0A0S3R8M9_PHAAN|nr:hypothetical protein VIGAN_01502500 [Vigna angularis var. angularis]
MIRERGKEGAEEVKGDTKFEAWKQQIVFHLIWASFDTFESLHNFFLIQFPNSYLKSQNLSPTLTNMQSNTLSLSLSIYKTMCLAMCQPHFPPITIFH